MRELRELVLPQLVEARRNKGATMENDSPNSSHSQTSHRSHSSTSSDPISPLTPTFSLRGHFRFPSSSSSLASSPTMRESLDGFTAKRPLTEVREEPHEKDGEVQLCDAPARDSAVGSLGTADHNALAIRTEQDADFQADYDWIDSPSEVDDFTDFDLYVSKRQRADDSASTRIGSHVKSLSRRWRSRVDKRISSFEDSLHETIASRSRTNSLKSPSIAETRADAAERRDCQIPLTPALSFVEDAALETHSILSDMDEDEEFLAGEEEACEGLARTPLLPPVMPTLQREEQPIQSPLQSPKVAESPCMSHNPFDSASVYNGLPSPPLSTRPSISSFHHRSIVPSSEIPTIVLADPNDEWARKLGHANFTIYPEPYLPDTPTSIAACNQLRDDWDAARCNYLKHVARTREHYSKTSQVFQLTEEKWAAVDATWKRHHEQAVASVTASVAASVPVTAVGSTSTASPSHPKDIGKAAAADLLTIQSLKQQPAHLRMPSINGPQSEGKFPKVGDEGIVGPMEQIKHASSSPQRGGRKRAFWKFLQGVLPSNVAFGRSFS